MAHDHGGLTEAETLETLRDPYGKSTKYAWITAVVIGAWIALFGLARLSYAVREGHPGLFSWSYPRRKTALWRYLAAKQQRIKAGRVFHFPVLGTGLIMLAFFLFMFIWTWSVRPYYMSHWYVSSPPLAIRTGMMALGCFPFIFAFASKVNAVTFVTGVSHEKLQVYHQYLSHLFLFLSWVHTIPFLIQGLSEYKPNYEPPTLQLNYSMLVVRKPYYWTGVILLVQLSVLCWGSLPYFRRKNYEFFKWFHVGNAIAFIGFFFVHCNRLLGSWDYLYATVVVYGACVVIRFVYLFLINGAGLPTASFEVLEGGMIKLRVLANGEEKWKPGQHYFLNFPACQPLQSHPFTVASMPRPGPHPHTRREMELLIREASGLTQKLRRALEKRTIDTIGVLLDGPYGGMEGNLALYEHVVLIAGGAGITFIRPVLEHLVEQLRYSTTKTKTIQVVWSVKTAESLKWLRSELLALQAEAPHGFVDLVMHVTQGTLDKEDEMKVDERCQVISGRADVSSVIKAAAAEQATVGIAACGPSELMYDVRNAAASGQADILLGRTGCKEIFLHTEEYSW